MQRGDPFFQTQKPHANGYLESLHRTYGEPRGALPKRDDELFKRAYEFRQQEKAKYEQLEREAVEANARVEAISQRFNDLYQETEHVKSLFEQLSKLNERQDGNGSERADARSSNPGSVTAYESTSSTKAGEGVSGGVPVDLLRPDKHDDRQADEHSAEGPEPDSGPGEADAATESEGGVPEAEK